MLFRSNNYVEQSVGAQADGGAIFNYGNNYQAAVINSIEGNFTGNRAISHGNFAFGGAILNSTNGIINNLHGDFTNNYTQAATESYGGAICNVGNSTIAAINGNFAGNYAASTGGSAMGGAIYNTGSIGTLTNLTFTDNYAKGQTAQGGAIWTNQDLNIQANSGTSRFEGNYIQVGEGDKVNDAIYIGDASKTLTLGAASNGKILFYDNIDGAGP